MGKVGFFIALLLDVLIGYGWLFHILPWAFGNLVAAVVAGAVIGWALLFIVLLILTPFFIVGLLLLLVMGGKI